MTTNVQKTVLAAVECAIGACMAAIAMNGEDSAEWRALSAMALLVSIRGYSQLVEYASHPDGQLPAAAPAPAPAPDRADVRWERIGTVGKVSQLTRAEVIALFRTVYSCTEELATYSVAEHERNARITGYSGATVDGVDYNCHHVAE